MTDNDATFNAVVICTLLILLGAAVVTDLRHHRVPNILLAPALSLALLVHTIHGGGHGLIMAAGGLTLGLILFLPMYVIGGMGAGDVKLMGVVGCFLGPWGAVVAGVATMMAGAIFGIAAIAWRSIRPVLELHAIQMLGPTASGTRTIAELSSWGSQVRITHIAYAPAIAVGTLAALWYIGYLPDLFPG
jgi:prepilin peptidase CpaA